MNRIVHQTVIRADLQKEDISTPSIREIKDMRRLSAIASRQTTRQGFFSHILGRLHADTSINQRKDPAQLPAIPVDIRLGTTLVRAVLLYRSKFSDCSAGAVPNSYPELDLLWDNVIAGPGDGPALRC